jgi:hypothetical protein
LIRTLFSIVRQPRKRKRPGYLPWALVDIQLVIGDFEAVEKIKINPKKKFAEAAECGDN